MIKNSRVSPTSNLHTHFGVCTPLSTITFRVIKLYQSLQDYIYLPTVFDTILKTQAVYRESLNNRKFPEIKGFRQLKI